MTLIRRSVLARLVILALLLNGLFVSVAPVSAALDIDGICGKRYIAAGDHVPAGHEVSKSERFPSQLREDHLAAFGFCSMNIAVNETTSATYISGSQLSQTWNLRPDLITLTVGEQNATIVKLITSASTRSRTTTSLRPTSARPQILGQHVALDLLDQQPHDDPPARPDDHGRHGRNSVVAVDQLRRIPTRRRST